jgi:arginine-tRNA-protein transferase
METLFRYVAPPSPCGYLPERKWSLEYEQVAELSKAEYLARMLDNWRRFGTMLFRPACADCTACRSLRVPAARFRPDRSQRRCRQANEGSITLRIGAPKVTPAKLNLYDRYHAFQSDLKGWPQHPAKDAASYADSFVEHPFPTEEWCYFLGERLVGVGYVDVLPSVPASTVTATIPVSSAGRTRPQRQTLAVLGHGPLEGGLSAIYFFHDPAERHRAVGTWNVLSLIEEAVRRGLPHVYLGYHVEGCGSMAYKARFRPNQRRGEDGAWSDYLS